MTTTVTEQLHGATTSRVQTSDRRQYWQDASEHASRQHGVVARRQLHDSGIPLTVIDDWVANGRLHVVHRGAYAVGHRALSFEGRCMAAVLAVGGDALVTGAAGAFLRGLERREPDVIDVVTTRRSRTTLRGGRVVRTHRMLDEDRDTVRGIPTTSVARMLVDRAARAPATVVTDIMHEAEYRGMLDVDAVERTGMRLRNVPGRGPRRMRFAIELHRSGSAGTQSAHERGVLGDLLDAGVPMPRITPEFVADDGR